MIYGPELERLWRRVGRDNDWHLPQSPWYLRLFIVRHVRAALVNRRHSERSVAFRRWLSAGIAAGFDR